MPSSSNGIGRLFRPASPAPPLALDLHLTPDGYVWSRVLGETRLEITVLEPGIVKVRRAPLARAGHPEPPSPAVVRSLGDNRWSTAADAVPRCHETAEHSEIRTAHLTVVVDHDTGLVAIHDAAGVRLVAETARLHVGGDEGTPQTLAFAHDESESFYGLGQKVRGANDTSLRWNGRRREFGPFGNDREKSCPGVSGQGNGNTTIPLLLSSAGYGIFFDNHYRHSWDLTAAEEWTVTADRGEHRYYVLAGPRMADVLQRYSTLTGPAPLPPLWAMGLLQSKFGYRSWDEVDAIAEAYREAGIPCDAIILDLYWFGGVPHFGGAHEMGSLSWDPEKFGNAAERIARLRERGFRVILIEEPYLDRATANYREAEEGGYLVVRPEGAPAGRDGADARDAALGDPESDAPWNPRRSARTPVAVPAQSARPVTFEKWWGTGSLLDLTNPEARTWWWRKHRELLRDGVAGWWADLGEPEHFDPQGRYHGGRTHADVHNVFNLAWAQALAEGSEADFPERRHFILTRSGYAGLQRYGASIWSNDVMTAWEWLAPQIATGLNVGCSGLPYWGTDVGGFIGPVASDALYTRWFQFGALSPTFRPHGQNRPTAPFEFSEATERICRLYARLRYRLLPYLYTTAREATDAGMPIMRPLVLEFPEDRAVHDLGDQYLLGPSLLVAPVVHEGTTRDVYLPAGEWIDFWTQLRYSGPRTLHAYDAPLDRLPLFVRAGAILPMARDAAHTDALARDVLVLRAYPGRAASSYELYEDDGHSRAYEDGAAARTTITMTPSEHGLTVDVGAARGSYHGMPEARVVLLELVVPAAPQRVQCNGLAIPADRSTRDVHRPIAGWDYAEEEGVLRVRLPAQPVAAALRIEITLV